MAAQNRWLSSALGACAIAAFYAAPSARVDTATPIKHLVVIFQENVSFDHYFGTYPNAQNPSGEPPFFANPDTPSVNGLTSGQTFPTRSGLIAVRRRPAIKITIICPSSRHSTQG
jgi:phospholipase C